MSDTKILGDAFWGGDLTSWDEETYHDDGSVTYQQKDDCTRLLELTKAQRDDTQDPKSPWRKVASIPPALYASLNMKDFDSRDWARWLNDPDNRFFRTWEGNLAASDFRDG